MTWASIRLSIETRDRLAAQALARGVTLAEYLDGLSAAADRGLRFEALRAAVASTPAELDEETRAWLSADLDRSPGNAEDTRCDL